MLFCSALLRRRARAGGAPEAGAAQLSLGAQLSARKLSWAGESRQERLGQYHELRVVAGAPRLDRQLQNSLAIHGCFLQSKALNGLAPEGNRLGGLKDPRTHIFQEDMAKL